MQERPCVKTFTKTCPNLRAAGFILTGSLLRRLHGKERCASRGGPVSSSASFREWERRDALDVRCCSSIGISPHAHRQIAVHGAQCCGCALLVSAMIQRCDGGGLALVLAVDSQAVLSLRSASVRGSRGHGWPGAYCASLVG
jgi:hypothetical protein